MSSNRETFQRDLNQSNQLILTFKNQFDIKCLMDDLHQLSIIQLLE